jgi:hypothetical protein
MGHWIIDELLWPVPSGGRTDTHYSGLRKLTQPVLVAALQVTTPFCLIIRLASIGLSI